MCNTTIYTSILSGIQSAVKSTEDVPFNNELIEELKDKVEPIAGFYGITDPEAILFAYFLNAYIKDQVASKDSIVSHFGKDIVAIAEVDLIIRSLADKRLVIIKGVNKRFKFHYKSVSANPKAVMAMTEGDIAVMEMQKVETFSDLLMDFNDLLIQRIYENISTDELILEAEKLLHLNDHLDEVKWIISRKDLTGIDRMIFLNICVEQNSGEDEVELDKMLKEVVDSNALKMKFKQSVKQERCILINNNYITMVGDLFGMFTMAQLSEKSLDKLFGYMKDIKNKNFQPRMGVFISHDTIHEEKLSYNSLEHQKIKTLMHALHEDHYPNITAQMVKNNMRPGFTVLMYGHPGTGKTSSVKSLARVTGRNIFLVDIPKINSKWVGESEKNIAKIFDEYKQAIRQFDKAPILLFNEADAIFGNRLQVQSSVDKMKNAMQNILLQELEDFEGIFIATTNLADQLDAAFDRRLLYKLEFKKPEEAVRYEILRNSFPSFDEVLLETVNKDYQLTGGQIANIKKKLLVKEMLEPDFELELELFMLCEEESSWRKSDKRSPIGFQTDKAVHKSIYK
ncbi:MAG: ATP-binding protein [Chitinophagaceae bacterium]|nr:ATP-binding protein [Chitinophagaceae bacterium]